MLRDLYKHIGQGVLILTVNRRLARFVSQGFDVLQMENGVEVWESANVLPLNTWLQQLWQECCFLKPELPLLLDEHQSLLLWEQVIAETNAGLLNVAATARTAAQAWRLMQQWQIPEAGLDRHYSVDVDAFRGWARAFERQCQRQGWLDAVSLPQAILAQLATIKAHLPPQIILYGFDELTPQHRALIDALAPHGCTINVQRNEGQAAKAVRVACADADEELRSIAIWLRQLIGSDRLGKTAIVVPQLAQLRARLEVIFDEVLLPESLLQTEQTALRPYDISLGQPLTEFPIVVSALRCLELARGKLEIASLGRLLLSPFVAGQEHELMARAKLDARLRRHGELIISLQQLQYFSTQAPFTQQCPQFSSAINQLIDLRAGLPRKALPSVWATWFKRLLQILGWGSGRSLDSVEYQTVVAWQKLISQFANLDNTLSGITYSEALRRLRQLAQATLFQPQSKNQPIQVMGILETAGLEFDNLWLMGLNDEVWPPTPQPNPFLPVGLQISLAMPHASAERELEFAQQTTQRLLQSANNVVVSYPLQQGDQDLRPSPLICDLPEQTIAQLLADSEVPQFRDVIHASQKLEQFCDWQANAINAETHVKGGTSIFKDQAACPFRAFARHRLASESLDEPTSGLDAAERGSLVHRGLEQLWLELKSHVGLMELSAGQRRTLVEKVVAAVIKAERRKMADVFSERFTLLEQDRLQRLMLAWLEIEAQRQPFDVEATEQGQPINIAGLELTVKVDRIDRLANGEAMMVDYKTGSSLSVADWFDRRPAEPQLPLYCVSHQGPVSAVAFAQVNAKQSKFLGLSNEVEVIKGIGPFSKSKYNIGKPSWDHLIAEWRGVLENLAQDFLSGKAEVDPKEGSTTCQYCDQAPLCRINELAQQDGSDD